MEPDRTISGSSPSNTLAAAVHLAVVDRGR